MIKNLIASSLILTLSTILAFAAPSDIIVKRAQPSKMSIMTVGDLCIDGSDVSAITAQPCNNSNAQKWYFVRHDGPEIDIPYHDRIYNAAHGNDLCLDAVGLFDSDQDMGRRIFPIQLTKCDAERTYSSQIWYRSKLRNEPGYGLASYGALYTFMRPLQEDGRIIMKLSYVKLDGTEAIPSSGVIGHIEEFVPEYIFH